MRNDLAGLWLVAMLVLAGCEMPAQYELERGGPGWANLFGSEAAREAFAEREGDVAYYFAGGGEAEREKGVGSSPAVFAAPQAAERLAKIEVRKVVYTAALEVVVTDVEGAIVATKEMAEQTGGYMQRMTGNGIVIRVPADRFEQAVEALANMGTITQRNITAQDVTEEYEDLEIRLGNARALLGKLRALLDKAQKVEEALAVERELARVRTEIERLEGRLNRLTNRVAYTTISVTFIPTEKAPEEAKIELPFYWLRGLGLYNLLAF